MALDLLEVRENPGYPQGVEASYLVACLCGEAKVCLTGNDYGNQICIEKATYHVEEGLVVTDSDGKRWRLRVTAEAL